MTGNFASQQPIVELYGCCLVCGDFHHLTCGNLIAGGQLGLLLGDGVLAGGQIFDVDFSCPIGSECFRVIFALHQEGKALQHAVLGGLLNQQTAFGVYCDSLVFIVDVRMGGNLHPVGIEGFEHHNGGSRQGAGVQCIGQLHGSISSFGSELHLSGDFRAIHQQGLVYGLVHKDTGHRVSLARGQASVPHHIHDGDFPCGISDVAAVHGSGGAQGGLLRLGNLHGLCFVVNIRMGSDFHPIRIESFKHHNGGPR